MDQTKPIKTIAAYRDDKEGRIAELEASLYEANIEITRLKNKYERTTPVKEKRNIRRILLVGLAVLMNVGVCCVLWSLVASSSKKTEALHKVRYQRCTEACAKISDKVFVSKWIFDSDNNVVRCYCANEESVHYRFVRP